MVRSCAGAWYARLLTDLRRSGLDGVALVTGASRGIGRAIARELAKAHFHVAIGFKEAGDLAEALQCELQALGCDAMLVQGDVGKLVDIKQIVGRTLDRFGRIDVLVNNAGVLPRPEAGPENITEAMWDMTLDTNLKGPMFLTIEVAKAMRQQEPPSRGVRGRVINIGSVSGIRASWKSPHYSASKAGLVGLTVSLAEWLGPLGILVNAIAPGFVQTDMSGPLLPLRHHIERQTPLGRWASPDEVAEVVLFFSTSGNFITGQVIAVDGGLGNTYFYIPE